MVVSDDVADALVLKLKTAGYEFDPQTVTCAELLVLLQDCEIRIGNGGSFLISSRVNP